MKQLQYVNLYCFLDTRASDEKALCADVELGAIMINLGMSHVAAGSLA